MDRNLIYAGISIVLAGMLGFSWAQGRPALNADEPKVAANDIAVVDLAKVFDTHKRLSEKREEVRRNAQAAQDDLKQLAEAAKKLQEELKTYKPGTSDYNRIQRELQQKTNEMKKFQNEQQQELQKMEAEIFMESYRQIVEEIQRIAEARGLRLVLRYDADKTADKDPKKFLNTLNRQVLYEKGLDITDEVIQAVNN
jgi:Skp family chaperone for outer membrane proteins